MIRAQLRLGWKSIPGYRHQVEGRENEDTVLVESEHPFFDAVLLVADGMGGHPEPKLASETAARAARGFLFDPARWQPLFDADAHAPGRLLREAVQQANAAVIALAHQVGEGNPPGTTLSAAVIVGERLYVAHAGDGSVLLMRDGRLQTLAGGEGRREGNRPQSFLGRAARVELEEVALVLEAGDRLLLCSDGLTRYFGAVAAPAAVGARGEAERAASALSEVLGRSGAEPQAIASQLTAHSRSDQYDDDTSVVIAEVRSLRDVPGLVLPREATEALAGRHSISSSWATAAAILLALALGWGGGLWWGGRSTVAGRTAGLGGTAGQGAGTTPVGGTSLAVGPVEGLPRDPLVLFDRQGRHLFSLQPRARPEPAPEGSVALLGARLLPDGQLTSAGQWQLDAAAGRLTDPAGRHFFVTVDAEAGTIRARHPGRLKVMARPAGAQVYLDGVRLGEAPLERKVPSGSHQLRLLWRGGREVEQRVDVPARGALTVELSR